MFLSSYKYIHIVFLGKELLVSLLNPKKNCRKICREIEWRKLNAGFKSFEVNRIDLVVTFIQIVCLSTTNNTFQ